MRLRTLQYQKTLEDNMVLVYILVTHNSRRFQVKIVEFLAL